MSGSSDKKSKISKTLKKTRFDVQVIKVFNLFRDIPAFVLDSVFGFFWGRGVLHGYNNTDFTNVLSNQINIVGEKITYN